jgi:hypothetical protein
VNKFDRILWRINGLLFLALLSVGIVQLASVLIATRVHPPPRSTDAALFPQQREQMKRKFFA